MTVKVDMTEYFVYLDELRESGVTNMFSAGPFVAARFDIPDKEARGILLSWMETYNPAIMPEVRAAQMAGGQS